MKKQGKMDKPTSENVCVAVCYQTIVLAMTGANGGKNVISFDLDNATENYVAGKLAFLRKIFPNDTILWRKSSSGHGYHILCYAEIPYIEEIQYRRLLSDDELRIHFDLNRHCSHIPEQVLFDCKIKKGISQRASEWQVYPR